MRVHRQEDHTIFQGDAVQVLGDSIADASVDLIFADPPYNIGKVFNGTRDRWPSDEAYLTWCYTWLDLCIKKLKPTGCMYLMAATQNMPFLDIFVRKHLTPVARIVWHYDSSGVQAKKTFGSLYEPILYAVKDKQNYAFNGDSILIEARTGATRKLIDYRKPKPRQYNTHKVPGNVWFFPRVRYRMPEYEEHPSQKPESLMERIIRASSNEGDVVLDPFAGTFTTCVVAKRLRRRSIGIEIDERYVGIGLRRLDIVPSHRSDLTPPPNKNFRHKVRKPENQSLLFGAP